MAAEAALSGERSKYGTWRRCIFAYTYWQAAFSSKSRGEVQLLTVPAPHVNVVRRGGILPTAQPNEALGVAVAATTKTCSLPQG